MSIASKLNKGNSPFSVKTEGFQFTNLKDLYEGNGADVKYTLLGVYVNNKGRFGAEPMAIVDGYKVNLPKHLLDEVQMILDDDEMIQAIIDGKLGFQVEPYTNSRGTFYSVHWIDL